MLFAGDGYLLLDTLGLGPEDLRRDNAAALLAGLETLELEAAEGLLSAFHKLLGAPELGSCVKSCLRGRRGRRVADWEWSWETWWS